MHFEEKLEKFGLNKCEVAVYLYLLEHGIATPSQIGTGTKISRTNTYHVLRNLKEVGLIEEHEQRGKKAYAACDPDALLRSLYQKRDTIVSILPDLRALHARQKNKPKIRFFDTWDQVKEIYLESLHAQEIFGIGSTKRLVELDSKFTQRYWKQAKKNGIVFRDILSHESEKETMGKIGDVFRDLHTAKMLPSGHSEVPTDILIWNDNVALITLKEPIFGTILTNPLLAQTFKVLFEVMWVRL